MSISVLTETIDYIAPFTSQLPNKFCVVAGFGSTPTFGKMWSQGLCVEPVKASHIRHNMSDETATLSRTVYEPIAIQVLLSDLPNLGERGGVRG